MSPGSTVDEINASGIAVYQIGGWLDMYTTDQLLWFVNLTGPQRLAMAGWNHSRSAPWLVSERLRWLDYWLKGIDNGIMSEPRIHYYTMGMPEDEAWRAAEEWPLPNEQRTTFHFQAGPSGTVDSINDGSLTTGALAGSGGFDDLIVDYSATVGKTNRFANGYGADFGYPDLRTNDAKGLTYTTPPLVEDVEVTGHPVLRIWLTSTASDGDLFAYLEEVDETGRSTYVTEGKLRISQRALHTPPYENMGLPWHRCNEEDVAPLAEGEVAELVFDLRPTSNRFDAGHRIRVTLTGADADTYVTPRSEPAPTFRVLRDLDHPSHIELPIIPRT